MEPSLAFRNRHVAKRSVATGNGLHFLVLQSGSSSSSMALHGFEQLKLCSQELGTFTLPSPRIRQHCDCDRDRQFNNAVADRGATLSKVCM